MGGRHSASKSRPKRREPKAYVVLEELCLKQDQTTAPRHERWFQVEGSINLLQTSLATVVSETMLPGRGHVPIVFSWHLASSLDLADQASVGVLE